MAGGLTISTLNDSSGVLAVRNGMTGIPKAWVNFNGTNGTVNNSFNVSSITRNGAGDYSVTFTTAMPNNTYVVSGSNVGGLQSAGGLFSFICGNVASGTDVPLSTTGFRCNQRNTGGFFADTTVVGLVVFSS